LWREKQAQCATGRKVEKRKDASEANETRRAKEEKGTFTKQKADRPQSPQKQEETVKHERKTGKITETPT